MTELLGAESEAVRFRAAADILDRTGFKAPTELLTGEEMADRNEAIERAILGAMARRAIDVNGYESDEDVDASPPLSSPLDPPDLDPPQPSS